MILHSSPSSIVDFNDMRFDSTHLGVDLASADSHRYPLHRTDFCFTDSLRPGDAKVMFQSGFTARSQSSRKTDNDRRLLIQGRVRAHLIVKFAIFLCGIGCQHL